MRDPANWTIPTGRVSIARDITTYNNSHMLYADMYAAIKTAVAAGHLIYLLGWHVQIDEEMALQPGIPETSLRDALIEASDRGVLVRAMYWYDSRPRRSNNRTNIPAVKFINSLKNGGAVMDFRFLHPFGSCHQKLLVIWGEAGLIAFAGGWDIHTYRWEWVDVHCRIAGSAAVHLLELFEERWLDNPDVRRLPPEKQRLVDLTGLERSRALGQSTPQKPVRSEAGLSGTLKQIQVVRTYGNCDRGGLTPPYSFAPHGETSLYQLLLNAIAKAREFIYLEDQYFFDGPMRRLPNIADVLIDRLKEAPGLTLIVLTNRTEDIQKDIRQGWYRRRLFYERLRREAPDRAIILQYKKDHHPYVHSKCWIFDDEFTILGSANCNRRSFSHDNEVAVGITGQNPGGNSFAKDLRMQLWRRHLVPLYASRNGPRPIELENWRTGLDCMLAPESRLELYDTAGGEDPYPLKHIPIGKPGTWLGDWIWDHIIDPEGS